MRLALALLFFSAVLFLPCVAPATESAQADATITAGVSEPSPGALAKLFGWFKNLGDLKLDGEAADDEARRYQDGQYVFTNGGTKGYHFVADLSPDFKPGFYLHAEGGKAVAADLSLMDPSTVGEAAKVLKQDGGNKVSFFMGPDMDTGVHYDREKGLGPDMPAINTDNGCDPDTGLGIRCGIKCNFN